MIRSYGFAAAFYVVTAIILLFGSPLLFGPRRWAMAGLKAHAKTVLWLLRWLVGTKYEVRGREHIPKGAALIACKHQSAWETFALIPLLHDPALIMKAELMQIPFYGWFSYKFRMIPVRREAGPVALRTMVREARERCKAGRHIVIFPEGTRRPPGARPSYKSGVNLLYDALKVPCCPVALNSGLYWPRDSWRRRPGTIVIEFLPPIAPGLDRKSFAKKLQDNLETATARLLVEARSRARPSRPCRPAS